MRSIIQQICNGDLHLNERTTACVSEFRAVRDIAVQAHANRLSETVQESYINRHPLPEELAIRTMAQMVANEVTK